MEDFFFFFFLFLGENGLSCQGEEMDLVRGTSQDQCGARPCYTGRTRVEPGRTGPKGVEGRAEGPKRAAAVAGGECTPEGARAAVQGSSSSSRVAIAEAVPEQASQ